jgi:hypothetical protein
MNGYCTYTVEVREDGRARDVACAKPRVGDAEGPGFVVALCRRHWEIVDRAARREGAAVVLTLGAQDDLPFEGPVGLATAAVEDVVHTG